MIKVQWQTGYILGLTGLAALLFRFAKDIGLILFISLLLALLLKPVKIRLARRFFRRARRVCGAAAVYRRCQPVRHLDSGSIAAGIETVCHECTGSGQS